MSITTAGLRRLHATLFCKPVIGANRTALRSLEADAVALQTRRERFGRAATRGQLDA